MKNLLMILCISAIFTSCDNNESGSGRIITEKRNTVAFSKINVSESIEVEIRKGTTDEVRVEADDNIIQYIETKVEDGTLRIHIKDDTNLNDVHATVFVTAPEITSISASSAASVVAKDILTSTGTISLDASSAAKITCSVDAPTIDATASSTAEIKISGRTKNFSANSSSASSIKAFELLSENTTAEASSSASVDAHASVSVDGNASSGGSIDYRGAASVIKKQESSGGSIQKDN